MANFQNDPPPKKGTIPFSAVAKRALQRQPVEPVYHFSTGRRTFKDSGLNSGIYAYNIFLGTESNDLTANNGATFAIVTQDGLQRTLQVTADATGTLCQAQGKITGLVPLREYELNIECHTDNVDAAGRIAVYDGIHLGFGGSEPAVLAEIANVGQLNAWTWKSLVFTPTGNVVTVGLQSLIGDGNAWYDINFSYLRDT